MYFNENSVSELWKDTTAEVEAEAEAEKTQIIRPEEASKTPGIKLTIIGALAFAFVYCMIWAVKYIFDGSLMVSDDLQQLIGVPHIGGIITVGEPSFVVDRWAYRLKVSTQTWVHTIIHEYLPNNGETWSIEPNFPNDGKT